MKQYIKATPAEVMLIELTLAEFQKAVQEADVNKAKRLSSIAASHPEAKDFRIEDKDGTLYLVYEDGAEPSVPPVS